MKAALRLSFLTVVCLFSFAAPAYAGAINGDETAATISATVANTAIMGVDDTGHIYAYVAGSSTKLCLQSVCNKTECIYEVVF